MKLLKDVLVDYDIARWQALAYKRGITPPHSHNRETLDVFVEALLSPASIAITINDLSVEEKEALRHLISEGGFLEVHKFTRLYGPIKSMGSSKLLREKPWETPDNIAEGLWYRALIFKGFRHTISGPEEVIFVPSDLQEVLPISISSSKRPSFQVNLSPIPAYIYPSFLLSREDLFTLLVYLQSNFVRLNKDDELPLEHRRAICEQFVLFEVFPKREIKQKQIDDYFDFILHLARRLDFLRKQGQRLKLNSQGVKMWLQRPVWEQMRQLQGAWRNDSNWNDLSYVPNLHLKQTGWENNPMLGRAKILAYLAQVPMQTWVSIDSFIQTIKRTEPDFQRTDGDYHSWYIYDEANNPLMGFEHWDEVEGALIRHLISTVLFSLGILELGAPAPGLLPNTFSITPLGQAFLFPDKNVELPLPTGPTHLRINSANFIVRVPETVNLYDRFQLARFADFLRRDASKIIYQITQESYYKALEQSIHLEHILAFLSRVTRSQTPLALVEALRGWDRRSGSVKLERLMILRVNQEDMVSELLNHDEIGPLLAIQLGPKAILVPEENIVALRKLLLVFGYLEK